MAPEEDAFSLLWRDLRRGFTPRADSLRTQLWYRNQFIEDRIIDGYGMLLMRWSQEAVHILPAVHWTLLGTDVLPADHPHVQALANMTDGLWLWPAHIDNNHWRLHILQPRWGRILVWDSAATGPPIAPEQAQALRAATPRVVWRDIHRIRRPLGGVWQRENDCALFLLQHAEVVTLWAVLYGPDAPALREWLDSEEPDDMVSVDLCGAARMPLLRRTLFHLFAGMVDCTDPTAALGFASRFQYCLSCFSPLTHRTILLAERDRTETSRPTKRARYCERCHGWIPERDVVGR